MNNLISNDKQSSTQTLSSIHASNLLTHNEPTSPLEDLISQSKESRRTLNEPTVKDNLNAIETACHLLTEDDVNKEHLTNQNVNPLLNSNNDGEGNSILGNNLLINCGDYESSFIDDNELTVIVDSAPTDENNHKDNELEDSRIICSSQHKFSYSEEHNNILSNINSTALESVDSNESRNEFIDMVNIKLNDKVLINSKDNDSTSVIDENCLMTSMISVNDSVISESAIHNSSAASEELSSQLLSLPNIKSDIYDVNLPINPGANYEKKNLENTDYTSRCIPYNKENKQKSSVIEPSDNYTPSGIVELLFPYICHVDGCIYTSVDVSDLLLHFLVNHSPSKSDILCSICCNQFNVRNYHELLNHICSDHYHKERQMVACTMPMCGRAFNRIHELIEHLTYFHDDFDNQYPCSFCFSIKTDPIAFENHIRTHFKNILICSYCSLSFDERESLISHIDSVHPGQTKKISTFVKIINHERLVKFKELPKIINNKKVESENKITPISKNNCSLKDLDFKNDTNKSDINEKGIFLKDSNNDLIKENSQSNIHIKNALNEVPIQASKKLRHRPSISDHILLNDQTCINSVDTLSEYIEVPNLDKPDIKLVKADKGKKKKVPTATLR